MKLSVLVQHRQRGNSVVHNLKMFETQPGWNISIAASAPIWSEAHKVATTWSILQWKHRHILVIQLNRDGCAKNYLFRYLLRLAPSFSSVALPAAPRHYIL
jgi:hypothetical protein